jgi:hypothetical protein
MASHSLTILNYARQNLRCNHCGRAGCVEFSAVDERERSAGGQRVISACKTCCEQYATEHDLVIRLSIYLHSLGTVWRNNRRMSVSPAASANLSAHRTQKRLERNVSHIDQKESDAGGEAV